MMKKRMKRDRTPRKKGFRKGQAVMEYLITYGLALFVILIVLGIIFAIVLPMLKPPTTCKFQDPNFSCDQKEHVLVADASNNVRILFQLNNMGSRSMNVYGVLCTTAAPGNVKKANVANFTGDVPVPIGSGASVSAGLEAGGPVPTDIAIVDCLTEGTTSKVQMAPNSNFKGTLAITYSYQDEVSGAPIRLAVATVTGAVQAE